MLRVAAVQARVTHGHPAAVAAAQAVAVLVHDAIAGRPVSFALPAGIDDPTFEDAWYEAHGGLALPQAEDRLPARLRDAEMSGWVTVAAAHAVTIVFARDPERAISAAAAAGGDTDTLASIAGAIVGARFGRSALPARWLDALDREAARACDEMSVRLAALQSTV